MVSDAVSERVDYVSMMKCVRNIHNRCHPRKKGGRRTAAGLTRLRGNFCPSPLVHIQVPFRLDSRRDSIPKLLYMFHRNGTVIIRAYAQPEVKIYFPLLDGIRNVLSITEEDKFDTPVIWYYARLLVEQDDQSLYASVVGIWCYATLIAYGGIYSVAVDETESAVCVKDPAEVHERW